MSTHVVLVSGGKDSTAMALRLAEVEPNTEWRYVCTPTGDELPDVVEHWDNLSCLLGKPIERVSHKFSLVELMAEMNGLPNHRMRWCTRLLKIETAKAWYAKNAPCIAHVGLRADEPERKGGIFGESVTQRYPLREWGWGLPEVLTYLIKRGVTVPRRTDCARCYDQRLSDWWNLWRDYPAIYADAEAQEVTYGHTFRNDQRDAWPTSLAALAAAFEAGDIPRGVELNNDLFGEATCRACTL